MDHIRKAILKAKAARREVLNAHVDAKLPPQAANSQSLSQHQPRSAGLLRPPVQLKQRHLEDHHIVAHLPHSPYSVGFDILRTRVYQAMVERGWKTLLVTSPGPDSGKTVTAINLAISLARQPNCFSVLVDTDFRKPSVAEYLGLIPDVDLADVVSGRHTVAEALQRLSATGEGLAILPTREAVPRPSEVLSSPQMKDVVHSIRSLAENTMAIFDAPPMLVADDVLAFLPEVDCVLLTISPDWTSYADTQASLQSIPAEKLIGTVFTRSKETAEQSYYADYRYAKSRRKR